MIDVNIIIILFILQINKCIFQYFLGMSGWADVPGGASAREFAECNNDPHTEKQLLLRAVNNVGAGNMSVLDPITTLGEFICSITTSNSLYLSMLFFCQTLGPCAVPSHFTTSH